MKKSAAKKAETYVRIGPPAEPTEAEYFERVVAMMRNNLARAQETLKKFRGDLEEHQSNPAHVLSWSNSVFEAAGIVTVYGSMIAAIDKPDSKVTLRSMRDYALKQTIRFARGGSSSTSPVDNHMAKCEGMAWAALFEMTDELLRAE